MDTSTIKTIADSLYTARTTTKPISTLSETYPGITVEEAYRIQLHNIDREKKNGRIVIGKKIGITSRGMQKLLGITEPDYGFLMDDMMRDGETPIPLSTLVKPKIEAEVAFILKEELRGPGVTMSRVIQATEGVMASFEIVDSRIADWKIKLPDTVADNASSALLVLGGAMYPLAGFDLRTVGMVFERNGKIVNTGAGAEVLGHPAAAVAWLANKLAEYGQFLGAGEIILSGALTAASEIGPGDSFTASFSGLGSVKATFV